MDAVAEKVQQLGDTIIFGPLDVFEDGRTVRIQDPQGAVFSVWQPKAHIGARMLYDPGAMVWHELPTTESGISFYTELLGMERGETMGPMD